MLHPMLHVVAQSVATTDGRNEHWPSTYWLVLGIPLAFYMACSLLLNAFGHSDQKNPIRYFFDSISNALERMTGIARKRDALTMVVVAPAGPMSLSCCAQSNSFA